MAAEDVPFETESNSVSSYLDGDDVNNCTGTKCETLNDDNDQTTEDLNDDIQHRNLTLEAKVTGNDVIEDACQASNLDADNNKKKSDCETGQESRLYKDVCERSLQCSTDKPTIKSKSSEKNIIDINCGEISTTVTSDSTDVSKSDSKRHNVFKSIIDRLARKESCSRLEHQTKNLFSAAGDSNRSGSKACFPPEHHPLMTATLKHHPAAAIPHSSTSPGILFTNISPLSSSSSVCSSSSSALNLSFLFGGFQGCDDSGMVRNNDDEQGPSADPPSAVPPQSITKFKGSRTNCKVPPTGAGKKGGLEKVQDLQLVNEAFLDDAEIFSGEVEMLDYTTTQRDGAESHPNVLPEQPVICLDPQSAEATASQETRRLVVIKRKYYKSLDYLQKVRIISGTLEKEREKLRLKRLCLQRALHQLRFLYNVTRLRSASDRTLDRQTISSLWNLAKFEEGRKEKRQTDDMGMEEEEDGDWNNIDKRLKTDSEQGSSPRSSSPALFSKEHKYDDDDVMQILCDDAVTTTSFPVDYSLRENVISRAHGPTTSRCTNPIETLPLNYHRHHHDQALSLVTGDIDAWRHINSPSGSAEDQSEEQRTDGFATINNIPAHSTSYICWADLPQDNNREPRMGVGGGHSSINHQRAHIASNRLEVNVGRTPAAAHESKRDLSNCTYLYCSQNC